MNATLIGAIPELLDVLHEYCVALDMSDVDHESFADSGADVVECLWHTEAKARALRDRLRNVGPDITVFVVATEWNRGADTEGAITIEGTYADTVSARRARWAAMREYIGHGHTVYGRRNDEEWDCDVTVQAMPVQTTAAARVPARPACPSCKVIHSNSCYCRDKGK